MSAGRAILGRLATPGEGVVFQVAERAREAEAGRTLAVRACWRSDLPVAFPLPHPPTPTIAGSVEHPQPSPWPEKGAGVEGWGRPLGSPTTWVAGPSWVAFRRSALRQLGWKVRGRPTCVSRLLFQEPLGPGPELRSAFYFFP